MASLAKELLELIAALESLRLSIYVDTASYAIFVYDYMLTFEDERTLMWPKKWSPMKVLFLMIRYLPFVDLTITATHHFKTDLSPEACSFAFKSAAWLINLGIVTAELILIIRTLAIWNQKRLVFIALVAWGITNLIPDVLIMSLFLKSIGFSSLPPGLSGCLVTSGNNLLIGVWVTLMVYESVIIALLVTKGIQMYKELGKTSLYLALFRDGAIFYVYIFALSAANVIVISTLSRDKSKLGMLASIERVTHSVLTGRLLLTLNKAAAVESQNDETDDLQSIQFEAGPRGTVDSEAGVGIGTVMSSLIAEQWVDTGPSASSTLSATGSQSHQV